MVGMMLVAFACFTALDNSAKWLVTTGMSPWAAVFARYAVHLAIVAALILPARGVHALKNQTPLHKTFQTTLLLSTTIYNFITIQYLPLTLTSTIFFSIPIFIYILSIPILNETVRLRRWIGLKRVTLRCC